MAATLRQLYPHSGEHSLRGLYLADPSSSAGEHFHSLIEGPEMHAAGRLKLAALYLDSTLPNDTGQFFAQFEPLR